MRFVNFLLKEFLLRGLVFTLIGTAALSSFYFLSIGEPPERYLEAGRSFVLLLSGSEEFSADHPGFSATQIIGSGAAITFPLALVSLLILVLSALSGAAWASAARYLSAEHGRKVSQAVSALGNLVSSVLASIPLFVGYWALGNRYGSETPFIYIALMTVLFGGLGWDASRFLASDMARQMDTTHATVFGTLGLPLGRLFPLPGTLSGYLVSSSFPRFIPYLAGKVPAIIGAVTIAEIVFSFPGLGSTLMDALLNRNTDLLVASVFILLCVNALVTFLVKSTLFVLYPRWYEKAV